MKGQFSRYGYNSRKRFSGLYNQQGRMITDSDLNEGHNILINKVNELGDDAIKSGVPEVGGMVKIDTTIDTTTEKNIYTPTLQKGDVYVDGIRGQFRERRKKGLRSLRGKLLVLGADIEDIRGRLKRLNEAQIATHLFQLSIGETTVDEIVNSLPPKEDNPTKDFDYYYNTQADFPSRPVLSGNKLVYVDLWQRPIFWFEEDDLVDPGWNGADTAFRTRTMVQIKTAPPGTEFGKDQFPQKGTAELASFLIPDKEEEDPCDPCAKELDIPVRTGNKLVRLEVLDVKGHANQPDGVLLAWSDENASLAYPTDKPYPEGFDKPGAVYEFFSEVTESHMGVFENFQDRKTSHLEKILPGTTPNRTDIPGGGKWPFVRRWNGFIWVKFTYKSKDRIKSVTFAKKSPAGDLVDLVPPLIGFSQTEETVKIEFGNILLSLHIQVGGNPKEFLAGDYWLTLVRENATGVDRVNEITKRPMGICHHYLPLFEINNKNEPQKIDDARRRQLSFPPLTDLPADHVSFTKQCDDTSGEANETFEGVKNVEEALLALCRREAKYINFKRQCPATDEEGNETEEANETFEGVENVEEALLALCEREAKHIKFDNQCDPTNETFKDADNVQKALTALCRREAEHIKFEHECGDGNATFEGVTNVDDALKALCRREAEHVNFNNTCEDTFGEATTVQQALDALCKPDCCDEHNRYLHDWGAVCGLKVICYEDEPGYVLIEPGALVDQTGKLSFLKDSERFQVFPQGYKIAKKGGKTKTKAAKGVKKKAQLLSTGTQKLAVKPEELSKVKAILKETKGIPEKGENVPEKKDEDDKLQDFPASLVLAIRYDAIDKTHTFELITKDRAKGLLGRSFFDKLKDCQTIYQKVFGTKTSAPECLSVIMGVALYNFQPTQKIIDNGDDYKTIRNFYDQAWERLEFSTSCLVKSEKPEFPAWDPKEGVDLPVLNVFIDLINATREAIRDCTCDAFIPECPAEDAASLVPLCEIWLDSEAMVVKKISNISCRKFCLSWRSTNYWLSPFLQAGQNIVAYSLCGFTSLDHLNSLDIPPQTGRKGFVDRGRALYYSDTVNQKMSGFDPAAPDLEFTKFVNTYSYIDLKPDQAKARAIAAGLTVGRIVKIESLNSKDQKDFLSGNLNPGEILEWSGDVPVGYEVNIFTLEDKVQKVPKVQSVIPVNRQPSKPPGPPSPPGLNFGKFAWLSDRQATTTPEFVAATEKLNELAEENKKFKVQLLENKNALDATKKEIKTLKTLVKRRG